MTEVAVRLLVRDRPVRHVAAADTETLARVNAEAVADAIGLKRDSLPGRVVSRLCRLRTAQFARTLAQYDEQVGRAGLAGGGEWLLERFIGRLEVSGAQHVPVDGPALILSNHPGLSDTLALFASIPRSDLQVVAAENPFLRALPWTSESLIFLAEKPEQRLSALRSIAGRLRSGGAVLTFPSGSIEPDPDLRPDDAAKLHGWSDHLSVLSRIARDVPVVPVIVRGVLSAAAQSHPFTRLRRNRADREWLGAMLQMLWRGYQRVTVRVAFGPLLGRSARGPETLERAVARAARCLIAEPPEEWTTLLPRQTTSRE